MTFIFDAPNETMLPVLYELVEEIEGFLQETKLLDARKNRDESLTLEENAKINIKAMLKTICVKYPKEAGRIFDKLWVLENGEKPPNAIVTFAKVFTRKDAIDFFTSLTTLVQ